MKNLSVLFCLILSASFAKDSIGIDINKDDVELLGSFDFSSISDYNNGTTYALDLQYLHTKDGSLGSLGFGGENTVLGIPGLKVALGAKAVAADNFLALPLFATASYNFFEDTQMPPVSLKLHIAYAPSVLSFRDSDGYVEKRVELDLEAISNIHIFAGYRDMDTDYKNRGGNNFNSSFYGGLRLSF